MPSLCGVDAEVGGLDRFGDGTEGVLVPGLDGDQAGFGDRDGGHLVEGHGGAVVVDADVFDEAGVGASGADGLEFAVERGDRAAHAVVGVGECQLDEFVVGHSERLRETGGSGVDAGARHTVSYGLHDSVRGVDIKHEDR